VILNPKIRWKLPESYRLTQQVRFIRCAGATSRRRTVSALNRVGMQVEYTSNASDRASAQSAPKLRSGLLSLPWREQKAVVGKRRLWSGIGWSGNTCKAYRREAKLTRSVRFSPYRGDRTIFHHCVQLGQRERVSKAAIAFQCGTRNVLTSVPRRLMEVSMNSRTSELWMTLCEQAAREYDSNRLLELVTQINDLLEQKENRLNEKWH